MKESTLYKIVRPVINLLFRFIFHPKIKGTKYIPKDGRVVLAGTHTKFLDCLLLMCSTNRTIHFLAKDELIHGPFGFVFKGMGIIPVDRKNHKDNAFKSALAVLKDDKVIGIFPEGTINRKKLEPTLPFKSGAVRMAYMTDSKIIPFVILGKYRVFGRSISIIFYEPYEVLSDNFEKETENFRNLINKMILERR